MPAQPVPTPESLAQAVWRRQRARWRVQCYWRRQVQRCNAAAVARREAAQLIEYRPPPPLVTAPVAPGWPTDRAARDAWRKTVRAVTPPTIRSGPVTSDPYLYPPAPAAAQLGLGLNSMKLGTYARSAEGITKYGDDEAQWRDVQDLGTAELRQFGPTDLFWNALASPDDANRRVPIPLDLAELRHIVLHGWSEELDKGEPASETWTNALRLGAHLVRAWRAGVKLRFTFFTLGGGSRETLDTADRPEDPDTVVTLVGGLHPAALGKTGVEALRSIGVWTQQVLRTYWSPAFQSVYPGQFGWAPPSVMAAAAPWQVAWHFGSLDLTNPVKRAYVGYIAQAVAELLTHAEALARGEERGGVNLYDDGLVEPTLTLDDTIVGIEIFNELAMRNRFVFSRAAAPAIPHAEADAVSAWWSAYYWALAWCEAAHGLLTGFAEHRGAAVRLLLPGIASYHRADGDDTEGRSWTYTLEFSRYLLSFIRLHWRERVLGAPDIGTHTDAPGMDTIVIGMDYHWYHWNPPTSDSLGALHAGWLASEVAALQDVLLDNGFGGAAVTVFESGTKTGSDAFLPPGADGARFQATDLWRRLLAARGGGAEQVAWHPWMGTNRNYVGMGLRSDARGGGEFAIEATARPVYFAYFILNLLFGSSASVTILQPSIPPRDTLDLVKPEGADLVHTGAWTTESGRIWIFRMEGFALGTLAGRDLSTWTVGYVLLQDPTLVDTAGGTVAVRIRGDADAEPVALLPYSDEPERWRLPDTDDPTITLPRYDLAAFLADPGFATDATPLLRAGTVPVAVDAPVVLVCKRHLELA